MLVRSIFYLNWLLALRCTSQDKILFQRVKERTWEKVISSVVKSHKKLIDDVVFYDALACNFINTGLLKAY